jgi:superfamily I DNA and/or RNA helicase
MLSALRESAFPWPLREGVVSPVVFVDCAAEEEMGGASKSNKGQVELVAHIVKLLRTRTDYFQEESAQPQDDDVKPEALKLSITALSPYSKQVSLLRSALPSSVPAGTIDGFQGRESDIIVFTTVRSNPHGEIGFVEDERRLNVAWTRAKRALIIVGNKATMTSTAAGSVSASSMWKRAIEACTPVQVAVPEKPATGA